MITFDRSADNIVTIAFDNPTLKVNTLSIELMKTFLGFLDDIKHDKSVQCVVITSNKPGVFVAGADINEIQTITDYEDILKVVQEGQSILNVLQHLPCPTVCVIDGVCLGGGLELALACDFRIASLNEKTQLGLPEVNLGIIPGFGGTQRLPRLIGLQKALSMILTGKAVNAKKAQRYGLVDMCYPVAFQADYIKLFLAKVLDKSQRRKLLKQRQLSFTDRCLDGTFIGRFFISTMAKKTVLAQTKGHYPAPLAALKSAIKGRSKQLGKGLGIEADLFAQCHQTSISAHLIKLFFSQEAQKKLMGAADKVKPLHQATVVGGGLMGSGIAWAFSYRHIPAVLYDLKLPVLQQGLLAIDGIYSGLVKRRRITKREKLLAMQRVTPCLDQQSFRHSDIVVEAVVEDLAIKQSVYKDLEKNIAKDCIIATNTSSISITDLAQNLTHKDRFIGLHFFSPVHKMPLVEIIPTADTSQETINTALALVKTFKKTAVVVKDSPGFLVNRILLPYVNEAMHCLHDGAAIAQIDQVFESFGMPVGPMTLSDNVGLDVGVKVLQVLEEAYGERMKIPEFIFNLFYDKQFLGKKTKRGFYDYRSGKKKVNTAVREGLKLFQVEQQERLTDDIILERCLFIMINEAFRCLDEQIVADARQLDLAMIMGTGFPPFRGGLCAYAQDKGLPYIVERLEYYERVRGVRFKPCTYLLECADNRKTLF